jgi:hypothetical protein
MMQYIEEVLARERAGALVINLDQYSYEFGNDLFGVFVIAGFDKITSRLRPVCVLAHGQTEVALKSLLAASNTADMFDITFASARAQLTEWLHHKRTASA